MVTKPDSVRRREIHDFVESDIYERPEMDKSERKLEKLLSTASLEPIPLDTPRKEEIKEIIIVPKVLIDLESTDPPKTRPRKPSDIVVGFNLVSSGNHLELDLKLGSMDRRERLEATQTPRIEILPIHTGNVMDQKNFSLHQHVRTNSIQEYHEFIKTFTPNETIYDVERFVSASVILQLAARNVKQRIDKEKLEREKVQSDRKSLQIKSRRSSTEDISRQVKRNSDNNLVEASPTELSKCSQVKNIVDASADLMNNTFGVMYQFIKIGQTIRTEVFEKKTFLEMAREKRQEISSDLKQKAEEIKEMAQEKAFEIRQDLREKAQEKAQEIRDKAQDFKEKALEFREDVREMALEFKEDFKERALEFKEEFLNRSESMLMKTPKVKPTSPRQIDHIDMDLNSINLNKSEEIVISKPQITEIISKKGSLISINDLYDIGSNNSNFHNCFGLFDVTAFLTEAMDEITLWELNDIQFKLGRPIIFDHLKTDHLGDQHVKCENGFLYLSDKSDSSLNHVLCLREAVVREKKYQDQDAFKVTINKVDYRFYVKNKEMVEKWIWVIRMNTGFNRFRYESFAPPRRDVSLQYFHCGKDYFADLANVISIATKEIMICGWMISPFIYLIRNPHQYRLDELLTEKAKQGVQVYILIWKDPGTNLIVDNGSLEADIYLSGLSSNIHVVRDPPNFGLVIWSNHQKCVIVDQVVSYVGGIDLAYNRWEDPEKYSLFDNTCFPGMDYVNPLIRQENTGNFEQMLYDKTFEPRMPWNDVQVKMCGIATQDVVRNFVERWNFAVSSSKASQPYLALFSNPNYSHKLAFPNCKVSVLRSASNWSFGHEIVEKSVYECYLSIIQRAQHYIYIENQFFISGREKRNYPKNKITEALMDKVRHAIKTKTDFKIYIMLPIQVASPVSTNTTLIITYWQYMSIYRGENSIFALLQKEFPKIDISQYICFTSLRNYEAIGDSFATEIIYIHSKLMIVDDRYVIIGSANINDRSMTGGRDSEIAVLIEDTEKVNVKMKGKEFVGNKFAHDLRVTLWSRYLQCEKKDMEDPIAVYDEWMWTAKNNTYIYNQVFGKIHSTITTENDLHFLTEYNTILKPKNVDQLSKIKGYIVTYPKEFLFESSKVISFTFSEAQENLYYM